MKLVLTIIGLLLASGAALADLTEPYTLTYARFGGTGFKTVPGSVFCILPSSLKEASSAGRDRAWLKGIGCVLLDEVTPALLIDKIGPWPDGPWQVRLTEKGITLWAHWQAFAAPGR